MAAESYSRKWKIARRKLKLSKPIEKFHWTMKKIEEKLPKDLFLKVHRSFIINTAKIIDIQDNSVFLGNYVIPVSRSKRSELKKRLNLL